MTMEDELTKLKEMGYEYGQVNVNPKNVDPILKSFFLDQQLKEEYYKTYVEEKTIFVKIKDNLREVIELLKKDVNVIQDVQAYNKYRNADFDFFNYTAMFEYYVPQAIMFRCVPYINAIPNESNMKFKFFNEKFEEDGRPTFEQFKQKIIDDHMNELMKKEEDRLNISYVENSNNYTLEDIENIKIDLANKKKSESNKKKIIINNSIKTKYKMHVGKIFDSITDASKDIGISRKQIQIWLKKGWATYVLEDEEGNIIS